MGKAENYIESYLETVALRNGFCCDKLVSPSNNGFPDRHITKNTITIFVECKRPKGGKISDLQFLKMKEINDVGGCAIVIATRQEIETLITECNIALSLHQLYKKLRMLFFEPYYQEYIQKITKYK